MSVYPVPPKIEREFISTMAEMNRTRFCLGTARVQKPGIVHLTPCRLDPHHTGNCEPSYKWHDEHGCFKNRCEVED